MPVSQTDLQSMIDVSAKELDALNKQSVAADAEISKQTNNQTLYQSMMDKAKADLEDRLTNVKLLAAIAGTTPFVMPYPSAVLVYGSHYGSRDIQDWAIKDSPGGAVIYAYTNKTLELWHPSWPAALPAGTNDIDPNATTYRINVNGLLQDAGSIRIKLTAHPTKDSVIQSVYIGERTLPYSSTNQDEVASSSQQFLFDGETSVTISAGTDVYSDWLTFNLDMTKEYFISTEHRTDQIYSSINLRRFIVNQADFQWDGDHASVEVWSGGGTGNVNSRCLSSLEGWDTASGPGWDGDVQLTRNINDWPTMKTMITSRPYGTTSMIAALNSTKTKITTRQSQIAAKNPALVHFQTYEVSALASGPGTVTPSGSVMVEYGKDQIFTFTPTGLAVVDYVVVDGTNIGAPPSYTFTNVQAEHSIAVYFI